MRCLSSPIFIFICGSCQCVRLSRCTVVTTTCAPGTWPSSKAQTKLSSNGPGVCPPDLRGAATANKTHKAPRPWHWPSLRLPAILPPIPRTAACCFVPAPRRGSSSHLLFKVALPPMPLFHTEAESNGYTQTGKTCK